MGLASWLGHLDAAKLLLDAGVTPDAGMIQGAQGGHVEVVKLLLDRGADVNTKSKNDNTPLHTGALQGGLETVQLLLARGADPNASNHEAQTPLHMAISGHCDLKTIQLLVESGAKLDVGNVEGVTPVRLAAIRGAKPVYNWLLAAAGGKEPPVALSDALRQRAKSTNELIAGLSSRNKQTRLAAQRELVARGEEIMRDIVQAMKTDTDWEAFYELITAMGPHAEAAIPVLEAQLSARRRVWPAAFTIDRIKPGAFADLGE